MLPRNKLQMCSFCHRKPINGTHPYCSKTCAQQAVSASNCDYCHGKPKHPGFNYCGKTCAQAAQAGGGVGGAGASGQYNINAALPGAGLFAVKASAAAKNHNNPKLQKSSAPPPPVGQRMGRGQTTAAGGAVGGAGGTAVQGPSQFANQPMSGPPGYVVLPAANQIPIYPINKSAGNGKPAKDVVYEDECRIPGCGHPVFMDEDGASEYCSVKHREEAVKYGLESPCIMCLALPQSSVDYFCGRHCREDALSKF